MRGNTLLCVASLVVTVVAGSACSRDDHHEPGHNPDVAQIAATTTPFQQQLLADGEVTFAEYEKATLAAMGCLERAGLVVDGPHPRNGFDSRFLEFSYGYDEIPPDELETMNRRMLDAGDECEQEYRFDVALVWEYQHLLTPQQREQQRPLVIDCLRAGGVRIADSASHEDVYQVSARPDDPAVRRCREAYPDYYVVDVH